MQRLALAPRADWRARADALGFQFHTIDGAAYWDETAAYEFTSAEIDAIDDATAELERIALLAVDKVVKERLYQPFGLDAYAAGLVERSWTLGHKNLYGRFDLCVRPDGTPPKLLEYNADTPTALFEASVVQWEWLQTVMPGTDQFNSIHEKLVDAWSRFGLGGRRVHFPCVRDHAEDRGTIDYLADTATQAEIEHCILNLEDIGWNGRQFIDLEDRPIEVLFKLYPWEWLLREPFAKNIATSGVTMIEPAWKMLLSNKAILALLWHMFPDHPNLLPAGFARGDVSGPVVMKPQLGREGANIKVEAGEQSIETGGDYADEPVIYQAYAPLPEFDGKFPVVGSWVIASKPAGIGLREDDTRITRNTSRFVPHFFRP